MELTNSELRVIERVRRTLRWRMISVYVFVLSSIALLVIGASAIALIFWHLQQHEVPVSKLLQLLCELEHSSGVDVALLMGLAFLAVVNLLALIYCLCCLCAFLSQTKVDRLLIKLVPSETAQRL